MIEKMIKDIRGIFKVQDKAMFAKQNIPCLQSKIFPILHFFI